MRVTGPGQPAHLLVEIIELLNLLRVPSAVIGALAVSFYGVPRSTNDADATIWLDGTGKTADDLAKRFTGAGYRSNLRRGDMDDPVGGVLTVGDIHENRIDLLLGIRGMDADAVKRCVSTVLLDSPVRIIGAEDLIAMKIFAAGVRDIDDVQGVLRVSGKTLDLLLLRSLCGRYGIEATQKLESLLKELPPLQGS